MAQQGDRPNAAAVYVPAAATAAQGLTLSQPPPLCFEGDLAKNFKTWLRQVELFMCANECEKKTSKTRAAILLHLLGDEGLDKFESLDLSDADKEDYDKVLGALKEYCLPKTNESINRHIFFERNQRRGESFNDYLVDLKKLSSTCGFGTMRDSLIKDKIISGINDLKIKERLLREPEITLDKCINMCRTAEIANQHLQKLHAEEEEKKIEKINKKENTNPASTSSYKCRACGYEHQPRRCPAYGKTCNYCKRLNHFATVCRNKKQHNVKEVQQQNQDSEVEEYLLGSINVNDWTVQE